MPAHPMKPVANSTAKAESSHLFKASSLKPQRVVRDLSQDDPCLATPDIDIPLRGTSPVIPVFPGIQAAEVVDETGL